LFGVVLFDGGGFVRDEREFDALLLPLPNPNARNAMLVMAIGGGTEGGVLGEYCWGSTLIMMK